LIGLNDGFVLQNVSTVLENYADEQFYQVKQGDVDMPNVTGDGELRQQDPMGPHEFTVILEVIAILGLVIGASIMRWSFTRQLLCNVPPSITESFFTMILLTGHNVSEAKRRAHLINFYLVRLRLICYVDTMARPDEVMVAHTREL
jgi:low-affinity ferrous iron transport protein